MIDSFNNEIQVGDRILYLKPRESNMYRKNQVGTVAIVNGDGMIVKFDSRNDRDTYYIECGYGKALIRNVDKFIKLETHEEVSYRAGDKVLCYCTLDNDHSFIGEVVEEIGNGIYDVVDELGIKHILGEPEILFLLKRTQFRIGDEVVVQKEGLNFELLFREGYNQSIPTRIDHTTAALQIVIEIDDPSVGWQRNGDTIHSYWTLTNTKKLFPKEFSYSLSLVEYLKHYNPEIFDNSEQTNSIEENSTVSNGTRGIRAQQLFLDDPEQIDCIPRNRDVSTKSTPSLIHQYGYTPDETRFCRSEGEEYNESDNLYLGIELEISGSSQESNNEEDAKEIMEVIQKDIESSKKSVYFKHDGSINGFEIVFHPHTIKAYNEYNWKEIFSTIKKLGYTNDDKKAGFHVHISRKYFGDTTEQNEALAKMVFLMYKFKEEIEPLAGRKDSDYATYSAKALKRVKENDFIGTFRWYCDSCGKYSAINSQHKDTFELRIFDGVTDKVRFRDILNFVENLCLIVKCTSITDITKVKLENFMPFLYSIEG